MTNPPKVSLGLFAVVLATLPAVVACSKDDPKGGSSGAASASASAAHAASATPASAAASSAPAASAAAAATASAAPPPPRSDCPKGSAGPGTFDKPCEGKGATRLMEATWTGKTDDKGPHFKVTNKTQSVILYGKITAYFYDKAGKQLEVKDSSGKGHPSQGCGGNVFGGVMKAGEKAVLTFSCIKKEQVPEGTTAIEAEVPVVGFADSSEQKSEFYWKNEELVPEARKKGGVK